MNVMILKIFLKDFYDYDSIVHILMGLQKYEFIRFERHCGF